VERVAIEGEMRFGCSPLFKEFASTDFSNLTTGFCAVEEEANKVFVCSSPSRMLTSSPSSSEKFSKSFLGALKGGGNTREAEKRGSSKLHKVFTPAALKT